MVWATSAPLVPLSPSQTHSAPGPAPGAMAAGAMSLCPLESVMSRPVRFRIAWFVAASAMIAAQSSAQSVFVRPVPGLTGSFQTALAFPPGTDRVIGLDRAGLVRITRPGDPPLASPVLDFSAQVPSLGDENGALGMALDPQFAANGYLYIFHSRISLPPVVARYTITRGQTWTIDPASRLQIIELPSFSAIHIAGWIGFGPDGLLYIAHGDNGAAGNAQNTGTLRGKILRIDVATDAFPTDPARNYAIPPANPFAASPGTDAPEIWLTGVRNPYRCSFDQLTGDFYVGDVGDSSREEVTRLPATAWQNAGGFNLGWPCFEGNLQRSPDCVFTPPLPPYQAPLDDFLRTEVICITGGFVYRGCGVPGLTGRYLFGNCASANRILSLDPANPTTLTTHQISGLAIGQPLSWAQDNAGEVYILAGSGAYKIVGLGSVSPDCDGDGVADACELAAGLVTDFNTDGVPDQCSSACPADFNGSGGATVQDIFDYLATWFSSIPAADINASGSVTVQDIFDFLAAWFAGC